MARLAVRFPLCRSELAREKRPDNAFIQTERATVDVHREQARSYKGKCSVYELLLANVDFPAARNGMPHGTASAD
ncbi:hypothetical protein PS838_02745 [Pseudomonas fluorescens]|jgi:hypothetical protein|nr:hypothetical protein PS838_02745 [Pseudomonas fluorescens]